MCIGKTGNKIRVMNVFSRLNIGGPSVHTILLTARLNSGQFESILVKGQEAPYEGNMLYLAEEKKVTPFVIPEMARNISLFNDFKALCKLYLLMREYKPHIVSTHTAKAGTLGRVAAAVYNGVGYLKTILKLKRKAAERVIVIHTFHGHVFNGYFNSLVTKVFLLIERSLAMVTDRVITVSEKQRDEILSYGIGSEEKVLAVPLGLELDRFFDLERYRGLLRNELQLREEVILVGIVARLVPVKNHTMFIEAARYLEKMDGLKFLVIGDGEKREELIRLVSEYGLDNKILFLQFRNDLEKIYADLDIVVLTSLNEGSPVALIEAMASAKPVVATAVGGVQDLFEDGVEGFQVPSGDAEQMAQKIGLLAADKEVRGLMGKKGRERVYPGYCVDTLIDRMASLYRELLSKH